MAKRILFSSEQIQARVGEIAQDLVQDHPHLRQEDGILFLAILKGAVRFATDIHSALANTHEIDLPIEYVPISSYGNGTVTNGKPVIETDLGQLEQQVKGKHIILVEDILDSGHTLRMFLDVLRDMGVSSIVTIVLLVKNIDRELEVKVDYKGFDIAGQWVEGYGIDTAQRGRGNNNIVEVIPD